MLTVPPELRGGRAAAVALVARQMAQRGEAVLPEALLPDYHRLSQAERERAERLAAEAAARNNDTEKWKGLKISHGKTHCACRRPWRF